MKNTFKKVVTLLMILMMTLALGACGTKEVEVGAVDVTEAVVDTETTVEAPTSEPEVLGLKTEYPLTIKDKFGEEVIIEAAPMTIISMSPEVTETIYGLGAGNLMIGRSSYCDFPAEVASVPDFGTLFDLNIENIVEANPDVIFLSSMASPEIATSLKEQGLTVITVDNDSSLAGTYDYFSVIGAVIDKQEEAIALTEKVSAQIEKVQALVAGLDQPTVYYVVYAAEGVDSTATGDTYLHEMITSAGGDNIAKDATNWTYSIEKIVEQDPDMLLVSQYWETKSTVIALEGYKDLTAVLEDRVYEVDENIFSRQGPRIGDAVEALAKIFHPEVF